MDEIARKRTRAAGAAVALLAAVVVLGAGAGSAAASPSSLSDATSTCWKDVINDWLAHEPNVVGTYPYACYTQAIQHLNSYQDVRGYSNAPDDIRRALLAALHNGGSSGGPGSSPPSNSSGPSGPSTPKSGISRNSGGPAPPASKSLVTKLFDSVGPSNAQSVPLPLLVLAGLAVLLLLAALGTWIARRIQSRRMTPAPMHARRD